MSATGENPYLARFRRKFSSEEETSRYVSALYDVLANTIGPDKLVLRAGKMNALKLMRSHALPDRICALQRLVFEDPTLERVTGRANTRRVIAEMEERLADLIAQRNVEDSIERKINAKMVERHQDYLKDLKMEALRDDSGPETPATQKKLEELEKLGDRGLAASALRLLRPQSLKEVVGQEAAIRALLAKISSPYPTHVILYGPPGVGKTTVARLALEVAKTRAYTPFAKGAPFVEATGATLRWDPRETTNPLLGSVHDPIYQGSRREFAESGIPEPKLGLVTRAHGGVLFIDEIGEMDPLLQTKLLKVLEDKKVVFESSYYDETSPNVPQYIKRLFREGAPADFILIGATTREPEDIDAAIRSRCAAVYFEPLTQHQIVSIVNGSIKRLGAKAARGVAALIASYTIEGRKAVQIVADAYGHALYRSHAPRQSAQERIAVGTTPGVTISEDDVREVVQSGRLVQHTIVRGRATREIGKTFGLGVLHYLGSIIEIEAVAFAAGSSGKGSVRFNDAAGAMAKDSVFNAAAVLRAVTGLDTANYDLHINVIGGGNIDGPSAGLAIFLALYSALTKTPLPQDIAVTGELSIQGKVRPVGGIIEKLYAARQAGMRAMLVPKENMREIDRSLAGIEVVPVSSVEQAFRDFGSPQEIHKASGSRAAQYFCSLMSVTNLPVVDRIPPQNLEAEMALLGSVLVDREIMGIVSEILRPEDFYAHVHESIYSALNHLYDRGEPLDKITLAEELRRRGSLENVGGLSYLSSLMDTVQTAASAAYYAKIVREKAVLRGLIHAGTRITQLGFENEEDVEGALDRSEQMVYEIGMRQAHGQFTPVSRLLKPAFEHIDKLFHSRGDRTGLTSGFRDIDEMTTGFQPGNFIILAARPGMGKTSLALNMAVAAAREETDPVAFFSLEMSNDELVQRLICAEAHISMHDMRRGNIKPHHWEKISDAMGVLNELPIYLDDAGGLSVSEIRSRCRRLKSANGLSAVFVDYLQSAASRRAEQRR